MSTKSPKCSICHHVHRIGSPHIWDDESVHIKHETKVKRVHNKPKSNKPDKDVYTARQVGIRQLRANLSRELKDLPFDIVRNGVVIGRVAK